MAVYRISKGEARELYLMGENITLCPSKMKPKQGQPFRGVAVVNVNKKEREFDKLVSDFKFYNVENGLGGNAHYYREG